MTYKLTVLHVNFRKKDDEFPSVTLTEADDGSFIRFWVDGKSMDKLFEFKRFIELDGVSDIFIGTDSEGRVKIWILKQGA